MKKITNKHLLFYNFILLYGLVFTLSCSDGENDQENVTGVPVAKAATAVTTTGYTANWNRIFGVSEYQLDVSEDVAFSEMLPDYNGKTVSKRSEAITGLALATDYYYRVRAVNDGTISPNSNVISVTTRLIDEEDLTLKEAATTFHVGVAVQAGTLNGAHGTLVANEFSSITSEYEMKMNILYPAQDTYNWEAADATVAYAQDNGLNLHGHALIWHGATPEWIENFAGTDAEFETIIENYITEVVTRYQGKVTSWDVVNEAVNDENGMLRNSVFRQKMGDDYIEKCFRFARNADPDVLLFYNDYAMVTNPTKQDAVFAIVDDLIANDAPIDGVGFQMHISYNDPSASNIQTATNRIVERNLKVHFSEVDIRANPNNDISTLTEERAMEQRQKIEDVVNVYNQLPAENKYAITVWGLRDNESWIISQYGHPDWPLLFDSEFQKKETYKGFIAVLQ